MLAEFKKQVPHPLRVVTLVLLVRGDEVLLAMKKRGFGQGWWNGVGGKVEPNETIEAAAIRETQEEIAVRPKSLRKMAILNFYFQEVPISKDWNQQMQVFLVNEWEGRPKESEEMRPSWHSKDGLPTEKMWPFDRIWVPRVLAGEKLAGDFLFGQANQPLEYKLLPYPG